MKPGQSSAKGSTAEIEVAKMVDSWYGVPPKTFWRTHGSGSWEEPGDIKTRDTALTGEIPWLMEVKHVKSLNFLMDVLNNKLAHPTLYNWIAEMTLHRNAYFHKHGKKLIRFLVFKANWSRWYVGWYVREYDTQLVEQVIGSGWYKLKQILVYIPSDSIGEIPPMYKGQESKLIPIDCGWFNIVQWSDFVQLCPPGTVKMTDQDDNIDQHTLPT